MEISEYIDCITTNPKTIFGIPNLELNEGEKADITLFNHQGETTFLEESILSTSKNSPFLNKILKGKAYGIFANNQLILN